MAICIPLSFLSLADNIMITIVMFFITALIYVQWITASFIKGKTFNNLKSLKKGINNYPVPVIGSTSALASSLGVIILNYALIYTVPSWINIRKKDIKIQRVIWTSTLLALCSYIAIGIIRKQTTFLNNFNYIAATAFSFNLSADLFGVFIKSNDTLNTITAFIYALVIIMSGIPINFIIARDNLMQTQLFKKCT